MIKKKIQENLYKLKILRTLEFNLNYDFNRCAKHIDITLEKNKVNMQAKNRTFQRTFT